MANELHITLPDGSPRVLPAGATARDLAAQIGPGLAKAAIGQVKEPPLHRPAEKVRGFILNNACRAYEFRVKSVDEFEPRVKVECQVVRVERMRDFFGFNRAKHAIVEAAILASRVDFLDIAEIEAEFAKLTVIVVKTGGPQEHDAMALLQRYVADCRGRRRREP